MALFLQIPESVETALLLPPAERESRLRQELAVALYAQGILGFGKARELAELSHYEFGQLLGQRQVERQYGDDELREDLDFAGTQAARTMLAVSDTSPLLNLAIVNQLRLLPAVFDHIVVPEAVVTELRLTEDLPGVPALKSAFAEPWLSVERALDLVSVAALRGQLDWGESEAIILARQLGARQVLIDERVGRTVARRHGLQPIGLVGILMVAKRLGALDLVAPVLVELKDQAAFRLSEALVEQALQDCGER